jgi:RHS repeat-associated protein
VLWRYQYGNHLGSVGAELDDAAQTISYEEFHPYGTSAYRLVKAGREVPARRYRYTGMERDEESGTSYHHARFYAPALASWLSADPLGIKDGPCLYAYCRGNPITQRDLSGTIGLGSSTEDALAKQQEAANAARGRAGLDRVETILQQPITPSGALAATRKPGTVVPDVIRLPVNPNDSGTTREIKGRSVYVSRNLQPGHAAAQMVKAIEQANAQVVRAGQAYPLGPGAKGQVVWVLAESPTDATTARRVASDYKEQIRTRQGVVGTAVAAALKQNPNVKGVSVTTLADVARARDAANRFKPRTNTTGNADIILGLADTLLTPVVGETVGKLVPSSMKEGASTLASTVVSAGIAWVGLVGVDSAVATARLLAASVHPQVGVAVASAAEAATVAFEAATLGEIAAAGVGAVGVAAVAVVAAGAAGYAVGTAINERIGDRLINAVPDSVYDLSYRLFFK